MIGLVTNKNYTYVQYGQRVDKTKTDVALLIFEEIKMRGN